MLILTSPSPASRQRGIARFASRYGWYLTIEDRADPPREWRGDGVLVTLGNGRAALADAIRHYRRRGIPVVDLTLAQPRFRLPRVCGDNDEIGRLAAEHFLASGFRHAAFYSSKAGNVQQLRADALRRHGYPGAPAIAERDRTRLAAVLRGLPKPIAVFAYSDNDATRVLNACRDARIAVPDEVAILGVDDNEMLCCCQPVPLSSIRHDLEQVGYEGAALLQRLMDGMQAPSGPMLVPPKGIAVRRSSDVVAADSPILRQAFQIIRRDLTKATGIGEIAAEVGVSRTELNRLARTECGHTITGELIRQRLLRARRLLAATDLPLREIARETGFCHAAHLANAFRRAFALTPGAYRSRQPDG